MGERRRDRGPARLHPRDRRLRARAPAFSQAILDNQVVHFRLAELKTEVEAARPDLHGARELRRRPGRDRMGVDGPLKAAACARGARRLPAVLGGMGYTWDNRVVACTATVGSLRSAVAPTKSCSIIANMGTLPLRR